MGHKTIRLSSPVYHDPRMEKEKAYFKLPLYLSLQLVVFISNQNISVK